MAALAGNWIASIERVLMGSLMFSMGRLLRFGQRATQDQAAGDAGSADIFALDSGVHGGAVSTSPSRISTAGSVAHCRKVRLA